MILVHDETYGLSPEAMFYVVGLDRILAGAKITARDRDEALALPRTFAKASRDLVEQGDPIKWAPPLVTLKEVRDALTAKVDVSGWRYTDGRHLGSLVINAQSYLASIAPPFLTTGLVAEDYWPADVDHGDLLRAYALLCRPWDVWRLLGLGGLMGDEVAALGAVLPETLETIAGSVTLAVIEARSEKASWLPTEVVSSAMDALAGIGQAPDPAVQALFAMPQEQPQQTPSPGEGDKAGELSATVVQKRQATLGSPSNA